MKYTKNRIILNIIGIVLLIVLLISQFMHFSQTPTMFERLFLISLIIIQILQYGLNIYNENTYEYVEEDDDVEK